MAGVRNSAETDSDSLASRLDAILALIASIWADSAVSDKDKDRRKAAVARLFNDLDVPGELGAMALSLTKGSYYNLVMRAKRARRHR